MSQALVFEQFVKASVSHIYYAFTNATGLREWMCDVATVDPRPGGRFYAAWNAGFYACGEYTEVEKDRLVVFTWQGRGEPGLSLVRVSLTPQAQGTLVRLAHEEIGDGEAWEGALRNFQTGWQNGLENLASVLESGEDMRFTRRPMLGILLSDFNAEIAAVLGVPVVEGVRIDGTAEGMGAQAAGLLPDDVIVGMAGHAVHSYSDLALALQGKRSGETVEVIFYRHAEKKSVPMQLSQRPLPAIPETLDDLAEAVRRRYTEIEAEIEHFFQGIREEEASARPAPGEWSIKEVLAHLIQGERFWHGRIAELTGGYERWADGFSGNLQAWIDATVAAYPTLPELLAELRRSFVETTAIFPNLPQELLARKSTYWRLVFEALDTPYHYRLHLEQMRSALEMARAV